MQWESYSLQNRIIQKAVQRKEFSITYFIMYAYVAYPKHTQGMFYLVDYKGLTESISRTNLSPYGPHVDLLIFGWIE